MKTKLIPLLSSIASLALLPLGAPAADATAAQPVGKKDPAHETGLIDVSKFQGQEVMDQQGKELGKLKQILVDPDSGRIRYAVIDVAGAAGAAGAAAASDSEVAVPFGTLNITKEANHQMKIELDATLAKLQRAPHYKVGEAEQLYTQQAAMPVYTYWEYIWLDDPAPAQTNSGKSATTKGAHPADADKDAAGKTAAAAK